MGHGVSGIAFAIGSVPATATQPSGACSQARASGARQRTLGGFDGDLRQHAFIAGVALLSARPHGRQCRGRRGIIARRFFHLGASTPAEAAAATAGRAGGDERAAATQWLKEHPKRGEVLIGWVQHPALTKNQRIDLEATYTDGSGGVWRSRALNFSGPFQNQMVLPNALTLSDGDTILSGTVVSAEMISGTVEHTGQKGGFFEMRALPACYNAWWEKASTELKADSKPNVILINPKGARPTDDNNENTNDEKEKDEGEVKFLQGPQPLMNLLMGDLFGKPPNNAKKKKKLKEARLSCIEQFSMRPDEVKSHLDRYVIKQDMAKEMLSVAICDHYNRAREELVGIKGPTLQQTSHQEDLEETSKSVDVDASDVADGKTTNTAPVKNAREQKLPQKQISNSIGIRALKFTDTDGDTIELKMEGGGVNEYVNGKLSIEDMEKFEIDEQLRTYEDDTGRGNFKEDEDMKRIISASDILFKKVPLRSKNYIKPNVLLLGPTGSGKTYLLKNLAELVGVPFVKADATKFTETGYVGRDAEDVMRELLTTADGDVDLAQVGIVYVDEIDKVCAEAGAGAYSNHRRGTQSTFLKLMEDTEVTISDGPLMQAAKPDGGTKLSTRHVLFVFSGAFSQLDKRLQEEASKDAKGFGFTSAIDTAKDVSAELQSLLHKAGTEELVKAGLEAEFVGRIPVRVALGALSEDDLYRILAHAEDGPVAQMVDDFRRYGVQLNFTEEALRAAAKSAVKEGTGARALVTVLEGALRRFKFHVPALVPHGCSFLEVTEAMIESPEDELESLLARYPLAQMNDETKLAQRSDA